MANGCDEFLGRLKDSAACPVCFLVLDKPRSLPCGHTFCLDCIKRVGEQRKSDESVYDDYRYDDDDYGVQVSPARIAVRCAFVSCGVEFRSTGVTSV